MVFPRPGFPGPPLLQLPPGLLNQELSESVTVVHTNHASSTFSQKHSLPLHNLATLSRGQLSCISTSIQRLIFYLLKNRAFSILLYSMSLCVLSRFCFPSWNTGLINPSRKIHRAVLRLHVPWKLSQVGSLAWEMQKLLNLIILQIFCFFSKPSKLLTQGHFS